jgi:hypothetical protein
VRREGRAISIENTLQTLQLRAAALQLEIDEAPDEATARRAADELHQLRDEVDKIRVLRAELNGDY